MKFLYISETSTCDHLPSSQHPNSSSFNVAPALRAGAVAGGEGMGVAVLRAVFFPWQNLGVWETKDGALLVSFYMGKNPKPTFFL